MKHILINGCAWLGLGFGLWTLGQLGGQMQNVAWIQYLLQHFWVGGFWLIVGSTIFDVDHLIYYGFYTTPRTKAAIQARMTHDYYTNTPHFYLCHTCEFLGGWFLLILVNPQDLGWVYVVVVIGIGCLS